MSRKIKIHKALALFPADAGNLDTFKMVPRGQYVVERVANPLKKDGPPWLQIAGEPWANAEACWQSLSMNWENSSGDFHIGSVIPQVVLAVICLGLMLIRPNHGAAGNAFADVPSMKMELSGLVSQLDNLPNHYPLMLSEAQRRYEKRYEQAIYSLDVYPRYRTAQQTRQRDVLGQRPDLAVYVATVNALDDELYRAWHNWGLSNRAAILADIEERKRRILSTEILQKQKQAYGPLQMVGVTEETARPWMELNERVEWEVVDTDPALKEVARQNRECADVALKLMSRINVLKAQIAKAEKPEKLAKR